MSKYTRSIRSILQANAGNTDISELTGLYSVALETLFPTDALNVISPEYRQHLVTGFTLHYLNDEIGLETLPIWRFALAEKLYNYGDYINLIYANLDKQVFADYIVHQSTQSGQHSITKTGGGTIQDVKSDDTTTNVNDTTSRSEMIEVNESGSTAGTGTVADAKTGRDTESHTGTDATAKTGSDTTTRGGTDTTAKTGTDTVAKGGTDEVAHTGTQGRVSSSTQTTENSGTTGVDTNAIQISYDTPMGSLQNLRTPGGPAKGTGVNYVNGQTYNYMTAAGETDQSSVTTDNTQQDVTGSDNSTTTYNDVNTKTLDLTDETTYNSTNTKTLDLEDATTYNSTNTKTLDLEDETVYNSTNTQTRNTLDTTSKERTDEKTGTDTKTGRTVVENDVTNTQTRNTTDTDAGTNSKNINDVDYTMNWTMLYRSMPLLNKLWDVFDDLFMCIY